MWTRSLHCRCFEENFENVGRIGAVAAVDVRVGIDDRAVAVDDIGGRDGQRPLARCTILGRNVVAELLVRALQLRRELIDKAKGATDVLPDIAQDLSDDCKRRRLICPITQIQAQLLGDEPTSLPWPLFRSGLPPCRRAIEKLRGCPRVRWFGIGPASP